jgi:hypothetical protein
VRTYCGQAADAEDSEAGQAVAPEADAVKNHIGDPDSWTWDEEEKKYFHFDTAALKIVWKA